jgi:hypothetical protein
MCVKCAHHAALALAALFSTDSVVLADFHVPTYPGDTKTSAEKTRAESAMLIELGVLMKAIVPAIAAHAREESPAEIELVERRVYNTLIAIYNEGIETDRPRAARIASAAHGALWLADALLYTSGVIEDMLAKSIEEQEKAGVDVSESGPANWLERLSDTRRSIAATYGASGESTTPGTGPTGNPTVDAVIQNLQRAGAQVQVVAAPGYLGKGPNGELH